jgi:hypothetical protein
VQIPARRAVRAVVLAANTPVAKRRLVRELAQTPRPLRVEIGGLKQRAGWVVTNVNAVARNFMDATTRWPIEDGAVAFAYADNVIEHITLAQARAMLRQAHRCLAPDGVIRLVTPDLRRHVELYLDGRASLESPTGRHYRNVGLVVEHPVDLVRVPIASFGHHTGYLYDFETLASELTDAGFRDIVRCELGESSHPELKGLDESREGGSQLVVEASK